MADERLVSRDGFVVREADLTNDADGAAVVHLLDMYARDPFGQAAALSPERRRRLLAGLGARDGVFVALAFDGGQPAGVAVCFEGFSTFLARPLINIHDLAVHPDYRRRGIGRLLLEAVEREAERRGCCKLTLEVREDNYAARRLYLEYGFDSGEGAERSYSFWSKPISREGAR